jgi:hypothetical protein
VFSSARSWPKEEWLIAHVDVDGDRLTVQIEGMDKLWTLKSRLDIPLRHITDPEPDAEAGRGWKGWRGPGVHLPGVLVAGTFHHKGDCAFWDVQDPSKTLVIHLAFEHYSRLVIGVDDPAATATVIRRALAANGGQRPSML